MGMNEPPTDYAMALDSLRDALARIAELERERDDFKSRTEAACAVARAQGKTLDALRAENAKLRAEVNWWRTIRRDPETVWSAKAWQMDKLDEAIAATDALGNAQEARDV